MYIVLGIFACNQPAGGFLVTGNWFKVCEWDVVNTHVIKSYLLYSLSRLLYFYH